MGLCISFLAIPKNFQIEDITRLVTLCSQLGIGLILFDSKNLENPNLEISARVVNHEPDMFFVIKTKFFEENIY